MTTTTPQVLPSGQSVEAAIAEGAHAYELDRKHVFHSWSAQGQIKPAAFDRKNPHYNSRYATLTAITETAQSRRESSRCWLVGPRRKLKLRLG